MEGREGGREGRSDEEEGEEREGGKRREGGREEGRWKENSFPISCTYIVPSMKFLAMLR